MLKEIVLKLMFDLLMLFKKRIQAAEEKSPVLVKILDWLKAITADIDAYAHGQELPPINCGSPLLDQFLNILLDFIASDVKAPADLLPILQEVSDNVLAVLTDIDPAAAAAYKAPPADPKAPLKEQGMSAANVIKSSLASLSTVAESVKDSAVKSVLNYHASEIGNALKTFVGLIEKW